jgi:hypothetical protein
MEPADLKALKAQAAVELQRLEAQATAKEVAAKAIGKTAIVWIFLLVLVGVVSSAFLAAEALPAVIGLVATATMALIQMVNGIVNEAKKEEKPEITIIKELIGRLDKPDRQDPPMRVSVDGERVTVQRGDDVITTKG